VVLILIGRLHIGVAMLLVGFVGIVALRGLVPALAVSILWIHTCTFNYGLTVIPMFILMGELAAAGGASRLLYHASYCWLRGLPGGLALSTIGASALFGACSGSSMAACATMSRIAVPEMSRYGYDRSLSLGSVAAGGTLAALIPPSVLVVIYCIMTQTSIGKGLMAGLIPGVLTMFMYMFIVILITSLHPGLAPRAVALPWGERVRALLEGLPMVALIVLVLGGLLVGFFTPTESGAIGAAGALLIGLVRKALGPKGINASLIQACKTSAMIFFIVIGAHVFTAFLALTGVPFALAKLLVALNLPPLLVIGLMMLSYIGMGCILDPMGMLLLTLPIYFPVVMSLGFDSLWFCVLVVKVIEIGMITPPVGFNVYIVKATVEGASLEEVFKGILWFLIVDLVTLTILVLFPQISLYLPGLMKR